ncbi:alpha/beta hydrolase [Pseudoalteromonas luteoviolacea]|uniref:alpha/beta fold hydrolase n=1 Tax=Pseudoalteromonas luteoviolacea TaxID=43657 RepID=UPI001F2CB811|nr:alpha/beta hydrolase [Pseudoalteromonas luteoviolacea]MCF6439492.1 alpha/beta hydrolase [Pseudoalteromonas luteoviolacea]
MSCRKVFAIPGTMCNELLWSKLSALLGESIEIIHCPIQNTQSLDALCEGVISFILTSLDERDPSALSEINLMGFSMGGYIASYLATKHPCYFKRLFIVSNSPTQLLKHEIDARKATLAYLQINNYQGISTLKAKALLDITSADKEGIINIIKQMDRELGEQTLVEQYQCTTTREDLHTQLLSLKIPIYFCYSTNDKLINESWFNKIKQTHLSEYIFEIEGSGHMLPLEKPQRLAGLIKAWLISS